ncbi:MAG: hypothetical protein M3040_14210 [Bacteroidota bacterium]|nr:hypothetical protein [Bacteroidota bacterium]
MGAFTYKTFITSILSLLLFFTSVQAYSFHPFYISVTEMNYNVKSKSFEVSCKMFAEDIENVLKQNYKTNVDLSNENLLAQNNQLLNNYITKHLSFNINSKAVSFKFVGFEKEKESVYCYLELTNVPEVKKLAVTNSILYDLKTEQINIMHVMVNGKRESTKVDYPKDQASFSF